MALFAILPVGGKEWGGSLLEVLNTDNHDTSRLNRLSDRKFKILFTHLKNFI